MTAYSGTQEIVKPEAIESKLKEIWEQLAKENKMRACLFNLIVFNRYSARTDYIRNIVQKVIEKFPCRVLFISEDPDAHEPYLKTAVSVVMASEAEGTAEGTIACDHIDIGVAGSELGRAPFVLLPHLLPDLPITLLWTEDPSVPHPLFQPLTQFAHRVIFDSESADNLHEFAKTVLELNKKGRDVADLSWARIEGWRDLIAYLFDTNERLAQLKNLKEINVIYNARGTVFFCHLKIQSIYLLSWLQSRLHQDYATKIESVKKEKLGPGTIISIRFVTHSGDVIECARIPDRIHSACIQISTPNQCDLPYEFLLEQTASNQSLVKEICMKGSSNHYLEMLRAL